MSSNLSRIILYFSLVGLIVLYTEELPLLHTICSGLRIVSFFLVLRLGLSRLRKLDSIHIILISYFFILLYSCIRNGTQLNGLVSHTVTIFTLLVALKLDFERDVNALLHTLTIVFSFFVFINFFLILLHPNGVWFVVSDVLNEVVGYYLIGGNRNQMGATLIVAFLTSLAYYMNTKKHKVLCVSIFLTSIISLLITGSKTSLLGLFGLSLFVFIKSPHNRKRALVTLIVGYLIFQYITVFTLTDFSSNYYLSYFIEDVLGKELTFSGRALIWEKTAFMIFLSPILGYGLYDRDWLMFYVDSISPHNFVYSVLLKGGVCLLVCLIILVVVSMRQSFKYKSKISITLTFGFWILLFMSIMEVYPFILYVYTLAMLYYSKYYQNSSLA